MVLQFDPSMMSAGMKGNIEEANGNNDMIAMAMLRNKTVSALKGKLLFLTGQILSGSARGRGCNRELVFDYDRSERFFSAPQKPKC